MCFFTHLKARLVDSIKMETHSAHWVAERALMERGQPPLLGVITDADIWPALSVAIHRPVVVMDGATHGLLYQPSVHGKSESDPGRPVTVQHDTILSGQDPLCTTDVLLIQRTGMTTYQLPSSNVNHHLRCLARRAGICRVSPDVCHGVEGYLRGWLRDVIFRALTRAVDNHRHTVTPLDVALALGH